MTNTAKTNIIYPWALAPLRPESYQVAEGRGVRDTATHTIPTPSYHVSRFLTIPTSSSPQPSSPSAAARVPAWIKGVQWTWHCTPNGAPSFFFRHTV
mgnify:CR=1 FL=1